MKPLNIYNPVIEIYHSSLKRIGDSICKSECPSCDNGILLVYRDPETLRLLANDRCVSCGQSFVYKDINSLIEREGM